MIYRQKTLNADIHIYIRTNIQTHTHTQAYKANKKEFYLKTLAFELDLD